MRSLSSMGGWNEPTTPFACRCLAGRDLRHVHHACNAGFLGGLGEEGSSLNDPGTDGVAKVSACDPSKRRSDVIQVEKITEHDFGTEPLEPLRPVVLSMGQGS